MVEVEVGIGRRMVIKDIRVGAAAAGETLLDGEMVHIYCNGVAEKDARP